MTDRWGTNGGSPTGCGFPLRTPITIEYDTLEGDLLAKFDRSRNVLILNADANWDELLAAYEREINRNIRPSPPEDPAICPVVPLRPPRWRQGDAS